MVFLVLLGHYVMASCYREGQIARLETESMPAVESGCLELWHNADGYLGLGREYIIGIYFIY